MRKTDRNTEIKNKVPKTGKFKPRRAKRADIAEEISHLAGNFSTCPICDEPLVARNSKFGEWIIFCKKCKKDYYSLSYK